MKILLAASLTILILLALSIKKLRAYKWIIMGVYMAGVIILFVFYNWRTIDLILPFYHPTNQVFYQEEFIADGEYPDAILPYMLDGKTIHVPEAYQWNLDMVDNPHGWESGYMTLMSIEKVLTTNGADVSYDLKDYVISQELKEEFEALGYLNDTFRYSFFHNDLTTEYGNAFYYYWFFSANADPVVMYICTENFAEDTDLCLVSGEDKNLYLISKEVYEREVSNE